MDHINGALWPLLSYLLVLFFSIFIVATMVTAVVGDDCWQQSDLVRSCGEHFVSIWESLYNVFMATFGSLDFDDLVSPLWDVSGFACVILCLYMPLIDVMKTVLWAHLCQKFVETASKDQLEERLEQLWNKMTGGSDSIRLDLCKEALKDRRWIKELSDQLGTSTRAFCKGAHHLLKLMDENGDKVLEKGEFIRGMMRLAGPAKNLELQWEMQEIAKMLSALRWQDLYCPDSRHRLRGRCKWAGQRRMRFKVCRVLCTGDYKKSRISL